jgi:hypothetical protein
MEGTSIHDLQYNSRNEDQYNEHYHNDQYNNGPHRAPQQQQQQQHHHSHDKQQKQNEQIDIDELARDISDNLNEKETFDEEVDSAEKDGLTLSIPHNFKDPLILLVIYFILSQASVRQLFGKYITYINPNEEGIVSQAGIIIYGIILVVLFMIIKKFL